MVDVQQAYRQAMADLGGAGRGRRTAELFEAGRAMVQARVLRANSQLRGEALRIAVARDLYRRDPVIQKYLDAHEEAGSA